MNNTLKEEMERIYADHEQRVAKRQLENNLEDKKHTRKLFLWFCGFAVVTIFAAWIFIGVVVNSLRTISDVGLKNVVEQVWCGKDAACKLPETK